MADLYNRTNTKDSVDVEQLAAEASVLIRKDRKRHADWNSVNALLYQRVSPKRCKYERVLFNFVGIFHITVKLALLTWVGYSLFNHVLVELPRYHQVFVNTIFLCTIYIIIFINYFMCMKLNNAIPDCWMPPNEMHDGGRCIYCKRSRPLRSHHCVACGCCQLRRDHHCYWIANCIGAFNYPYFVSLTMYDCILSGYTLYMTYEHAENALMLQEMDHPINLLFLCGVSAIVFPILLAYFLVHIYFTLSGRTSHECVYGYGRYHQNPFDNGIQKNWESVFGSNIFAIFWPFLSPMPNRNFMMELNNQAEDFFAIDAGSTRSPSNSMLSLYDSDEEMDELGDKTV